ncbi:MAG TPA: hypothetical protein VMG55_04065 [Stellaceae bacterium]|nr:hypothetical protein [Stellaceae bacterium]
MRRRSWVSAAIAVVGLGLIGPAGAMPLLGGASTVEGPINRDLYLAGPSIDVQAEVDGDVTAAGGRIAIGDDISGSVMAAGGSIEIRGVVRHAVRAAGGALGFGVQVGRDLVAAGGSIRLRREGRVSGSAWLKGGNITVDGAIDHDLDASGGTVAIAGKIGGTATIRARSLRILPGAKIDGRLIYESGAPATIDPTAVISGGIEFHQWTPPQHIGAIARAVYFAGSVLFALALLAAGLLWVLVFPGYSLNAARLVASRPLASLGLGFAVLVAAPIAAGIAMLTLVGGLVGGALLALYAATLLLALLTAALFLGDALLRIFGRGQRTGLGRRLAALVFGVILLAALAAVPILGAFVLFLAFCFGLGGFFLEAAERY